MWSKPVAADLWRSEFDKLWDKLVPSNGQANTIQGELVRCAGRLADEAYRNGNGNFDDGYRIMCNYLRIHLHDATVFNAVEIAEIDTCILRILDYERPDIDGPYTCYDVLAKAVVRWCSSKKTPIPNKTNPLLYR